MSPYDKNKLALSDRSILNSVSSALPAGLSSFDNQIYLLSTVYDAYSAFAIVNTMLMLMLMLMYSSMLMLMSPAI